MYRNFHVHSPTDGLVGCFHVLSIVNSAAMNTGEHMSCNSGFLGVYAQQRDCWIIWQFYFQIFKESLCCSLPGSNPSGSSELEAGMELASGKGLFNQKYKEIRRE